MKTDKPILKISFARERLTLCSFFSQILECPNACFPHIWKCFVSQNEDVWVKASGSTLRVAEKYALIGTRITFWMRSARRMIGRLSLAQIRTMLILFAARVWVSTKLFSMWAKTCAPELRVVAEIFLSVDLRTSVLWQVGSYWPCDSASGPADFVIKIWSETSRSRQHSIADYGTSRGTGTWCEWHTPFFRESSVIPASRKTGGVNAPWGSRGRNTKVGSIFLYTGCHARVLASTARGS